MQWFKKKPAIGPERSVVPVSGDGAADSLDPVALRRMALVTLHLLRKPESWIHRRVTHVHFKDTQTVHHEVSVDFTLPGVGPVGSFKGQDVYIAPLFLLVKHPARSLRAGKRRRRKFLIFGPRPPALDQAAIPTAPYSNVDFVNQDGCRQPLLTPRQSRLLATTVLLEAAEQAIGKPVSGTLKERISEIPHRRWSKLEETLRYLLDETGCCRDARRKLQNDDTFPELVYALASHSLVTCLFMDGPPPRSIYKLSYDEPVTEAQHGRPWQKVWARIRLNFGWRSERVFFSLPEIGASESYHVEIEVPSELEINAVSLVGKHYRWFDDLLSARNQDYSIQQIGNANEGKIYIPEPLSGRRVGLAWVKLRARRGGFLVGALVASCITTAVLALAATAAPEIIHDGNSEAAVVALLLVPTLLTAYVARPGEHAITTKMLRGARYLLVADAGLLFLAVYFLLRTGDTSGASRDTTSFAIGSVRISFDVTKHASDPASSLQKEWWILAGISLVFVLLFAAYNIWPRPHGETVYRPQPQEFRR